MKQDNWNKDKVWNNLEEHLNKERRRKILFFWSIGLLLIAFLLLSGYFLLNPTDHNYKVLNEDKLIAALQMSSDSSRKAAITTTENELTPQKNANSADTISQLNVIKNKSDKDLLNKEPIETGIVSRLAPDEEFKVEDQDNRRDYVDQHQRDESITSLLQLEGLPLLSPNFFELKRQLYGTNIQSPYFLDPNKIYSWAISIQLHASKPNWQGDRPKNEQILFSTTQDILLSKNLSNHISVFGGISHERIWINYAHTSVHESQTEIYSDSGRFYDVGNDVSYYESGLLTQTTIVQRRVVNNNSISRVSIPIGIEYYYPFNRFRLYGGLGLRIRLFQLFDGVITDKNDGHLEDIRKIREYRFKRGIGIGFDTQLGLAYQFNSNWSLGIHYKFRLDDVFQLQNDNMFDDLIFQGAGLQLRYKLVPIGQ